MQEILDLLRADVLTLADDDVLQAARNHHEAVFVDEAEITRAEEARKRIGRSHGLLYAVREFENGFARVGLARERQFWAGMFPRGFYVDQIERKQFLPESPQELSLQ